MGDLELAMSRALRERTAEAAWAHLVPFRARLLEDRDTALAWATLLGASPGREGALEDARAIAERFGRDDPGLAAAAITAMIRIDERRPLDEPAPEGAPARIALEIAEAHLAELDGRARCDPGAGGALAIARGNALRRIGRDADALHAIEGAIAAHGARAEWLFDLGLCHKQAGRFAAARIAFERARALFRGEDRAPSTAPALERRAVLANLAISAIGSEAPAIAADALRAMGFTLEREEPRPFVADLRPVQIRVPTRGAGIGIFEETIPERAIGFERLWVQPLSPCHGVIRTPTFREAIADWGDVVLWDLSPVTGFEHEGRRVPVFPLLGVLHRGAERRLRFLALEQREGQVRALGTALPEGVLLYEHGARVERLCARCAAGEVLSRHAHEAPTEHRAVTGKILVPPDLPLVDLRAGLEAALLAAPGILFAIPSLFEALGETALAGKHHKSWGVIERGMLTGRR